MVSRKKKILSFVTPLWGLLALFLVAVNTGSMKVTPLELFKGLFIEYNENVATIYDLRFPRILIAIFGGAATAVSGVLLQAVMKNPLADPGIIGVSSGASLTAVLITAFVPTLYFFTPLFAFLGGMIAFLLVYSLSWKGGLSPLRIILVGVAVNAMFTGLMSAFNSGTGSNYSGVASIVNANITMKTWDDFQTLLLYVVIGLIASIFVLGQCNLLALEDKTARSLGRERHPQPDHHFGDRGAAGFHQHGGHRPDQLPGVDRPPYRKTAGGKQSQGAGALFHPAGGVHPAAGGHGGTHHCGAL